ncbi:MAG: beta-propeller domain-containing protein [Polyangiaceae bacterium]|nr:beta-propeller domain-containing protein [Polyangiaceae bacterium]
MANGKQLGRFLGGRCSWLLAGGLFLSGCASGDPNGPAKNAEDPGGKKVDGDGATSFVSEVVGQSSGGDDHNGFADSAGEAAPTASDDSSKSAERAITEADILKIEGDTLFALSRYSGLTLIDISTPRDLAVLGNYRSTATPFEMYVEEDTAYIMYSDWGYTEWDESENSYVWRSTSRMQAIDLSEPRQPRLIGEKLMPGTISDSRKVGDVIYVVTYQSAGCWQCDATANTRISSFDVTDPQEFAPVDEMVFETEDESYGARSVSVSPERMYVSGWAWSSDGQNQSTTIQVVDISDPGGNIREGATVPIAGQIESRWQMDEYDGVLRVISQPGEWRAIDAPVVETFQIESATSVVPLGRLVMTLPRSEDLQSVRFDAGRAFAVTFEQTDPLFTFDLSDPAHPLQMGELEIPGFLYHMEPRGDRMYALGFDNRMDNGALHVSIFDVSVLSKPTMLDRVNFGGDWGWLAEDQDRVHKLFNLALDQGLILLPFTGGGTTDDCSYSWTSGIQLIDVRDDDLTLRGVAPQIGEARRAVLHDDVLFGISDNAVQTFDISDRDRPVRLDRLDVARNVTQIKVMGDELLRFGQDWWTGEVALDVATLEQAEAADALGVLDLSALADVATRSCEDGTYSSTSFAGQVFVHGNVAFVPRTVYSSHRDSQDRWSSSETMTLVIVDLADRSHPVVSGEITLEPTGYDEAREMASYYSGIVQTENALLVGRSTGYYRYDPVTGERAEPTYSYDVLDLRKGAKAKVVSRLEVPSALAWGGWGYGVDGCMADMGWGWWGGWGYGAAVVSGDIVASQHEEALDDGTGRVRYYLDRIDVSDPARPEVMGPINIPGQVLHYDHALGRLVTLDYELVDVAEGKDNQEACYDAGGNTRFELDPPEQTSRSDYDWLTATGNCHRWYRRLNSLVLEDGKARRVSLLRVETDSDSGKPRYADQIAVTDSRLFFERWTQGEENWDRVDPEVVSLALTEDGRLSELGSIVPESAYAWGELVGRGKRAFLTGNGRFEVITSESGKRLTSSVHELRSWGCYGSSLEVAGDTALCALGMYGVQRIPLE